MKCDFDTMRKCPAYPQKGLDCWKVTGTRCDKGIMAMATQERKILHCRNCGFYKTYAHRF
ncbi:MAG: hypothetical protein HZA20_08930 [Nitrospirae bacterium]|nr:hypothetical protein [Nitrospirota bacterium]